MQVLNETAICESKGEKYNGTRKNREHKGAYLIPRGSVHERMLCDCIETGLGLNHTALLLNKELKKDGLTEIGVSCLRDSYLRLNPVVIEIRKVPMGTNDAHSPWAKASFNMYKQLAICFDQLDPSITCDPPMPPPLVSIATTNATNVTLDTLAVADIDTLAVAAPTLPPATTALEDARGNQENNRDEASANPDSSSHETTGATYVTNVTLNTLAVANIDTFAVAASNQYYST